MKVTLRFSAYIPPATNSWAGHVDGLPATGPASQQWRMTQLAIWGCRINRHSNLVSTQGCANGLSSLITARTPYFLKSNNYYSGLTVIPTLNTTPIPPALEQAAHYSASADTWLYNSTAQHLCNNTACIQLTAIESLLVKTLTRTDERVCSKQELIIGINKDAYSYSGLEMCLSRLQNKFKKVFGERLFRSVRNRGYCLVQDVKTAG